MANFAKFALPFHLSHECWDMSCENWCHCLCWMVNCFGNTLHQCTKSDLNTDFRKFVSFFYVGWDLSLKTYLSVIYPATKLHLGIYHISLKELLYFCFPDSHVPDPGFVKILLMLWDLLFLFLIWTGNNLGQDLSSSHRAASWILGHEKAFMHHGQNQQTFFPNAWQGYEVVSFSCCSQLSVCPSRSLAPEGDMASFTEALTNKYIYTRIFLL